MSQRFYAGRVQLQSGYIQHGQISDLVISLTPSWAACTNNSLFYLFGVTSKPRSKLICEAGPGTEREAACQISHGPRLNWGFDMGVSGRVPACLLESVYYAEIHESRLTSECYVTLRYDAVLCRDLEPLYIARGYMYYSMQRSVPWKLVPVKMHTRERVETSLIEKSPYPAYPQDLSPSVRLILTTRRWTWFRGEVHVVVALSR